MLVFPLVGVRGFFLHPGRLAPREAAFASLITMVGPTLGHNTPLL